MKSPLLLILCAVIIGQSAGPIIVELMYNNKNEFEVHKKHKDNGEVVYNISAYNWRNGKIARSKYLYGLTKEQVDSVRIVEERVGKKIK